MAANWQLLYIHKVQEVDEDYGRKFLLHFIEQVFLVLLSRPSNLQASVFYVDDVLA